MKVGTFYDIETDSEYDLHLINARLIKAAIDISYPLTPLKLNMFNGETRILSDIESEVSFSGLIFDFEKGVVLGSENKKRPDYTIRLDAIKEAEVTTGLFHRSENDDCHHLGYELLPLAISLKGRDLKNLNEVEIIDGFKRMFWMKEIPDRDVFVKVYDVLTPKQWHNAMLLYNSWKIPKGFESFADRGFKLSMYKHFGIDITLADARVINVLEFYFDRKIYDVFKDSEVTYLDIKLIIELYQKYVPSSRLSKESRRVNNMDRLLEYLAQTLGDLRAIEKNNGTQKSAVVFTQDDIVALLETKDMQKHIVKIGSMQVGGFVDNYIKKNVRGPLLMYIRSRYGIEGDVTKFPYFYNSRPTMMFPIEAAEDDARAQEERKNKLKGREFQY